MSDALEQASLIMVPTGYENGTLGSLKPLDGSGDFTFSRGSDISATRVNEDGYIEKGYENLLLQSNTFSDATWGRVGVSVTGGQEGYDGSNDAFKLSISAAFAQINQSISSSNVKSFSVYAKSDTLGGISLRFIGGNNQFVNFNLNDGLLIGSKPSDIISRDITDFGNGWYRCTATTNISFSAIRIYPIEFNGGFPTSGSIYIQDAMLNQGLVAYPYVETTTAPVAGGILEDMPRLDYSGSCPALLLEPQRTNIVENSEYFGSNSGWLPISSNQIIVNETNIVDSVATEITSTTSNGGSRIYYDGLFSPSINYTATLLVKPSANPPEYLGFTTDSNVSPAVFYRFSDNQFIDGIESGASQKCNSVLLDDGWRRLTISAYENAGQARMNIYQGRIVGTQLYGTIGQSYYLKFVQVEEGSYPTSYIPTYGTSQTRLADDMDLSLSAAWDSTGSWTMFFELERMNDDYFNALDIMRFDGTGDLYIKDRRTSVNLVVLGSAGASTANTGVINKGDIYKIAVKWDGTTMKAFFNGGEILFNNPSSGAYGFTQIPINTNHKKYQEIYFPTALSDDECIALTTIS